MMRTVREGVPQGLIVVPTCIRYAILSYGPPNASLGLLVRFIFLSTILTSFMEAEVFWLKAGALEIKVAAFKMNMGPVLKMKGETLERGSSDFRLKVTY